MAKNNQGYRTLGYYYRETKEKPSSYLEAFGGASPQDETGNQTPKQIEFVCRFCTDFASKEA
jgi:hypothetical protein